MVAMIVTNAKLGVSSFQGNEVFALNCRQKSFSSSGFSLSRRPTFVIGLNIKNRTPTCGTIARALSNGGSDSKLAGGALLGKEFEFKPSFDEYLKVMESVRTVRDKKQKSMDNLRETFLSEGSEENVKLGKSEEHLDRGMAFNVVEKDEAFKSTGEDKRKRITEVKVRFEGKENNLADKGKRKPGGDTSGRKSPKQLTREEEAVVYNYNIDMRRKHRDTASFLQAPQNKGTDGSQLNYRSMAKGVVRQKIDVVNNKLYGRLERNCIHDDKVIGKDIVPKHKRVYETETSLEKVDDRSLKEERAAFRNFNEFNDVLGKQRLPRTEMDERIQKLAKSLNVADIDMPEWMFSKMMRSARIIFTDHSISRVIQILGKFGNWRRVVQVIEWLQIRERFKSCKLRYIYTTALYVLGKARRPVEVLSI